MANFRTNDGVEISYQDSGGGGCALLLVPGWAQTQRMFKYQYDAIKAYRRVITFDLRGHGRSAKPRFGYRIARLAEDMHELIRYLDLDEFDLLAWAMGAMIAWSYIDRHGTGMIRRLVLVDQSPVIAATPWMSPDERVVSGASRDMLDLLNLGNELAGPGGRSVLERFERTMFSGEVDSELWQFILEEIGTVPTYVMLPLLVDMAAQDWRDVLPRLDVPTLVIGCEGSPVPVASLQEMTSSIPGAEFRLMPGSLARSHLPFLEDPMSFNQIVGDFLGVG